MVMTVRNIPDEVYRTLRVRAAMHDRSAEAEVRAILEDSVKAEGRINWDPCWPRLDVRPS